MKEYTQYIADRFIMDFKAVEGILLGYALERMANVIVGRSTGVVLTYDSFDDIPVEALFNYRERRFTYIQFFYGTLRQIIL